GKSNKLRHGPCERRRRPGSLTKRSGIIFSIPNLLGNHQPIIRESRESIQPPSRRCDISPCELILTTLARQQRPETTNSITRIVVSAVRSFTVGVVIVSIPRVSNRCLNFY